MPPVVAHLGTDASRTDCSFGPTRGHHASERPGRGLGEAALPHPHYAVPPAIAHLGTHPAPARYLGWAMLSGGSKRSEKRGPPAAPSCLQCWGAVVLPHRLPLGHEPPKNRVASFGWPVGVSTAAARSPPAPVVAVPSWSYLSAKRSPPTPAASASIRLTTLPVSRGFTAVRIGSRLRFLVQQRAECVFVAVFKFSRFDRLHGRDARSKPKFSVAVAVAAVVVAAVAAVAVAAVAVAAAVAAAVVAAAVVAVIVTVIGRVAVIVIGRVAVGPVSGAGA